MTGPRARDAVAGVGLAAILFTRTFGGPRERFWQRMTVTGLVLGGLAVAAEPELRRLRQWYDRNIPRDARGVLNIGAGAAA